jgi:RNA polymerase sigma factor (sigma-70 family)
VNTHDNDPLPTHASLLDAIKDPEHARWEQFHKTYRGLLIGVARKAGLNDHESEEALQDTLLSVAQKMPAFQYDPTKDSFKGWLLQIVRWKIADQFRKRWPRQTPRPLR